MKTLAALTLMLVPAVAFAGGGAGLPLGMQAKSVTLTEKAVERIGIETATVREGTFTRKLLVDGMVMSIAATAAAKHTDGTNGGLLVSVPVSPSELQSVAAGEPARILPLIRGDNILPLIRGDTKTWVTAKPIDNMPTNADQPGVNLHYAVNGAGHSLVPGQRVSVELTRTGAGKPQKIVPHSSVLYDVCGKTWVYTNPKPLVYVRYAITVDFIEGDIAVLNDGPAVGTKIVSVGVPGAETEIGK